MREFPHGEPKKEVMEVRNAVEEYIVEAKIIEEIRNDGTVIRYHWWNKPVFIGWKVFGFVLKVVVAYIISIYLIFIILP